MSRSAVAASEIQIGDEILVPVSYADKVVESDEPAPGILRRALGSESVDRTMSALRRAFGRRDED